MAGEIELNSRGLKSYDQFGAYEPLKSPPFAEDAPLRSLSIRIGWNSKPLTGRTFAVRRQRSMTESGITTSIRSVTADAALPETTRTIGERFVDRDTTVLEELYDRVSARAFGLAYRVLSDKAAAEDVVHDAFAWLWDNGERVDPNRGSVDSLLMTIVHRRSIDAVRSRSRRAALGLESIRQRIVLETGDVAVDAELLSDAGTVARLVRDLPPEQRSAIDMAYFEGMTHVEIAEASGIPLGTVKGRLRLAMNSLRKSFGIGGAS